jgi:hypothetical protein
MRGVGRSGVRPFPSPLVFASGQVCYNFDQLAQVCEDDWPAGAAALRSGLLAAFFRHIGRNDRAQAARAAADGPDIDLGLNDLLGALPGLAAAPPPFRLLSPPEADLPLRVREEPSFDLRLGNRGRRLLCGAVRADSPGWRGPKRGRPRAKTGGWKSPPTAATPRWWCASGWPSSAAARASTVPAFGVWALPVQAWVQAEGVVGVSACSGRGLRVVGP